MASLMIAALQEQNRYQAADAAEARIRRQQQQQRQSSQRLEQQQNEEGPPTESSPVNRRRPTIAADGSSVAAGADRRSSSESEGDEETGTTSNGGRAGGSESAEERNGSSTSPDARRPIDQEMQEALNRWESRRRRQTFIQIVLFFFLLRLWMQALITGDGGLLLLCVILSIWFTKVQEQRRAEEQAMLESAGRGETSTTSTTNGEGNTISSFFFREDGDSSGMPPLRPFPFGGVGAGPVYTSDDLSFQMQLAIAMMESQRMMHEQMNNGMMPTTDQSNNEAQGVPSEVQQRWKRFQIVHNSEDNPDGGGHNGIQIIPVESTTTSPQSSENESSSTSTRPPLRTARETGARLSRFHRAFMARRRRRQQSHYASLDDDHDEPESRGSIHDLDLEEGALVNDNHGDDGKVSQGSPTPLVATAPDALQSKFLKVDDLTSCSICLGDYESSETLVELPCGHVYHDDCVKAWVERSIKCPLCNYTLDGTADGEYGDK